MRIESDTTPYTGDRLGHSHHHHITKCMHEEKDKKPAGGTMGIDKDAYQSSSAVPEKSDMSLNGFSMPAAKGKSSRGLAVIKGFWDSLGEEGEASAAKGILPMTDRTLSLHGVKAAVSAVKQNISYYIVNKWEAVREKIKVGAGSLLKRFGKKQDQFSMLSDAGHYARGQRKEESWSREEKKGTRSGEEKIPSFYQADSHLMDSYSKTGEYCRLNENLTYNKNRVPGKK